MKNKSFYISILSSIICLVILSIGIQVTAEENGGAIGTKGEIILEVSDSSIEPPKGTTDTTDSGRQSFDTLPSTSDPRKAKPVGRYPSTGELVKVGLSISGLTILIVALILFLWKKKKQKERG